MKFAVAALLIATASAASADPLNCTLRDYSALPGLSATASAEALILGWEAERGTELRLRLTIDRGVPTIDDLAVRARGGSWASVVTRATPDFRIVTGLRRMSNQQIAPLRDLSVEITPGIVDAKKWDAFWDAPLDLSPPGRGGNPPPAQGIASQPGLPRRPEEIRRAAAVYRASACEVKRDGGRLEVSFPGLEMGVFKGALQFTVYKGTSLVRMEAVASTTEPGVAYKYDAGLIGLTIDDRARVVWRDVSNLAQEYRLGGRPNESAVPLKASNRLIAAEGRSGVAGGVSASAHVLLDARGRDEPRLRLVPQGHRRQIRDRHPSGGARGRRAVSRQLRAVQRAAWKRAADAGLLLRERRRRPVGAGRRARVHAQRSLQGVARLPGHGEPLPHGSRSAHASVGKPRHEAAGSRGAARGRHQHREPDRSARWRRPARDPRRLLRGRAATLGYELPDHAERGGQPVPWRPLGSAFSKPLFWTRDRKPGQPLVEDHPKYGKVYRVGSAGGHPGDDPARERADLHAASAHEGIDRIPRRGQGHGPLPRRSLPGCRLAVGDGPRSVRAPALRLPGAAAPRRHEQLDGGGARVDDDAEADSGDHGDLREASGRRHLREQSGQLHPVRQVAGGRTT